MIITKDLLLQMGFVADGLDNKNRGIYSLCQSHHPKISMIDGNGEWTLSIDSYICENKHITFQTLFFALYIWGFEDGKEDKRCEIWKALGLKGR